ncbi:MAG: RnfABCDGE type electron transport complex subunit G [Gemmatimonadetes bacterium]|nr:RnfABCDGE type electron transport complex subunit G [Gemmatimonadota bacterium]
MSGADARGGSEARDGSGARGRVELPVVSSGRPEESGGAGAAGAAAADASGPATSGAGAASAAGHERSEAPWWYLLVVLGTAGALAGALIVVVFGLTQPRVQAYKARVLQQAIAEVLKAPERYDTLYVVGNELAGEPPAGADVRSLEQVYLGFQENGEPVGFAVVSVEPGFQDLIRLIFGYDPATHKILGMKVLESRETPGLGDKILKDEHFITEFEGAEHPLVGVKIGSGKGGPQEVDMITGATISSRAVIRAINGRLERLGPLLDAYASSGGARVANAPR